MPTTSFTANVAACQELLRDVQECFLMRGSDYMAESVGQISGNLYRMRQQHDAAVEQLQRTNVALQARQAELKVALDESRKTTRLHEEKVKSRDETIEDQSKIITRMKKALAETKDVERKAFREGVLSSQEAVRNLEAKNQSLSQGVLQRDLKIKGLNRDLERAQTNAATSVATAYQKGFNDGQKQERRRSRSPLPPQPAQRVGILMRESLLKELKLTNTSGHTLAPNLEAAIKQGQPEALLVVLERQQPTVRAPALHIAALFGDVRTAEILIKYGANVNDSCIALSSSGGHLYGVTPMHLAVAAQHEAMIRCLARHGGHFDFGAVPNGKRATGTPAYWLVSERWLRLAGKADSGDVLRILRTMKACGWRSEDVVDQDGDDLRSVVWKNLNGRPVLQRELLQWLDGRIN